MTVTMTNVTSLPDSDSYHNANCDGFNFIFCFVVIGIVSLIGIVGNTVAIIVLQNDNFHQVTLFLFKALAVADNSVLAISFVILSLIYGLLPYLNAEVASRNVVPFIIKYVHPFAYMSYFCTIWITTVLAAYRYISVCRPAASLNWYNMFRARLLITFIVIIAILINIPRFLQFEIVGVVRNAPGSNTSRTLYYLQETGIGEDTYFGIAYNHVLYTLMVVVIPVIILVVINVKLIAEIQNVRSRRNSVGLKNKVDENITLVMVVIIIVAIACHTPDRILQALRIFLPWQYFVCGKPLFYVLHACNFLLVLNSATNFIIYYLLWPAFHRKFIKWLCSRESDSISQNDD